MHTTGHQHVQHSVPGFTTRECDFKEKNLSFITLLSPLILIYILYTEVGGTNSCLYSICAENTCKQ